MRESLYRGLSRGFGWLFAGCEWVGEWVDTWSLRWLRKARRLGEQGPAWKQVHNDSVRVSKGPRVLP